MSKHTTGPWNIMPSKRSSLLHIETDALCAAGAGIPICSIPGNNLPNALLIAAAPELIEACKALNGLVIVHCSDCDGSGLWPNGHQEACHTCGGVGENVEGHFHPDELRAIRAALKKAGAQ